MLLRALGLGGLLWASPMRFGKVTALTVLHHPARSQPLLISASTDDTTIRAWDCQTGEEIL